MAGDVGPAVRKVGFRNTELGAVLMGKEEGRKTRASAPRKPCSVGSREEK
jgi:hypothetical protein